MTLALVSGFLLGFLSSAHCVGMCGPIVLATSTSREKMSRFVAGRLLYNGGRVITYMAMGGLLGLLGFAIPLPDTQRWISIGAGVSVILFALLPQLGNWMQRRSGPLGRMTALVSAGIGRLARKEELPALFSLGLLNGLLPCGLVYVALAAALAYAEPVLSMSFMAGFGVGTVPVMVGVALFPRMFSQPVQQRLLRVVPLFTILVGALLIVRGLNLGIPYISPKLVPLTEQAEPECCH